MLKIKNKIISGIKSFHFFFAYISIEDVRKEEKKSRDVILKINMDYDKLRKLNKPKHTTTTIYVYTTKRKKNHINVTWNQNQF